MQKDKSFTLIELLVILALFSLLAGLIMVAYRDAREKARITAVLEFSSTVYHALGYNLVGYWKFDDESDPTKDYSGYGNDGDLMNMEVPNDYTSGIVNKSLSFDGVDEYVNCGNGESLKYNNNFTVEMWIMPKGAHLGDAGGLWAEYSTEARNRIFVRNDGSLLAQYYIDGVLRSPTSPVGSVITNKWSHVILTYNGLEIVFWLNGQKQTPVMASGLLLSVTDSNRTIGRGQSSPVNYFFNGLIDEVRIYNEALTSVQIQQHYAEGLEGHQDLAVK